MARLKPCPSPKRLMARLYSSPKPEFFQQAVKPSSSITLRRCWMSGTARRWP